MGEIIYHRVFLRAEEKPPHQSSEESHSFGKLVQRGKSSFTGRCYEVHQCVHRGCDHKRGVYVVPSPVLSSDTIEE